MLASVMAAGLVALESLEGLNAGENVAVEQWTYTFLPCLAGQWARSVSFVRTLSTRLHGMDPQTQWLINYGVLLAMYDEWRYSYLAILL